MDCLFVALSFGLAWALRGHFGHEHGAAWAGTIGSLAVLIVARRPDWWKRAPVLAVLAGIGWGVGGMMSYGIVVGYGRSVDLLNVWYGLAMLAVVGGLYGFIGGGFLGLGLETSAVRKPDWAALLSQMVAGGILGWGVLIAQLDWRMTPPRSELWAACLGASFALAWYLRGQGFRASLNLAGWSAVGAGFGFAAGNSMQTLGAASGIGFNWWNVMEFGFGFFGGVGLWYGVSSQEWERAASVPAVAPRKGMLAALLWIVLIIPAINVIQAFSRDRLEADAVRLEQLIEPFVLHQRLAAGLLVLLMLTAGIAAWKLLVPVRRSLVGLYWTCLGGFLILSHVRKAVLTIGFLEQPEQMAYWGVILVLLLMLGLASQAGGTPESLRQTPKLLRWKVALPALLLLLALFALIAVSSHDGLPGAHNRF